MDHQEWQSVTSGRYSQLSRPIGVQTPAVPAPMFAGGYVVNVHSQTVLFLLFAVLVGVGLFMVVPNLSAGPDVVRVSREDGQIAESEEVLATADNQVEAEASPAGLPQQAVGDRTVAAQAEPPAVNRISPIFTREIHYWEAKILEWSALYNLDPDIIATIMQIESCGDPGAASYAGAQGLFQVMPFHFTAGEDMLDPDTNARRGMAFYNRQLEYTGWDIYLSFAGYNGGYAASGSSYPYWANETQRYFTWAKGIFDDAKAGLTESPTLRRWLEAGGGSGCHRAAQRLGL